MYDRILIPTDGSSGTSEAVAQAIDLAERYEAALHVVYVVDTSFDIDDASGNMVAEMESIGDDAVERVSDQARAAGVPTVETSLLRGVPHRAILDYVGDEEIDLVVMGTHGRTGLSRYLLGSVTEKVVRLADVPVLTVPMTDEDES